QFNCSFNRETGRHITIQRIMCAGLISHGVKLHATPDNLRKNFSAIANQADGNRTLLLERVFADVESFIQVLRQAIAVSSAHAPLDSVRIDFDAEKNSTIQSCRQRLCATHASKAARQKQLAAQITAKVAIGHRRKSLKCAL